MMYSNTTLLSELTRNQADTLQLVREVVTRHTAPQGLPEVMPMWRSQGGVELEDQERAELSAVRAALEHLERIEPEAHRLLLRAGHRKPLQDADEALLVLGALDQVEAHVDWLIV